MLLHTTMPWQWLLRNIRNTAWSGLLDLIVLRHPVFVLDAETLP